MKPISVTSSINKNGVLTLYVLMDDGTIMKKADDDARWSQIDAIPGDEPRVIKKEEPLKKPKKN